VATSLTCQLPIPADPHAAFLLLSDPDYVREVAARTGGRDVVVTVEPWDGGAIIRSHRVLPARLPSYARALVGETVTIHETRTFGPAATDGSRDGTIEVTFGGAPAHVTGTMRLEGAQTSNVEVVMSVKASVPLVGGKVERLCADQIDASIAREAVVAAERTA
jgi:hypothetical protein